MTHDQPPSQVNGTAQSPPAPPLPALTAAATSRSPRRKLTMVLQLLGFLAGMALLVWCVSVALRPEYRDKIDALRTAPWHAVGLLFALSVVSLLFNGVMFWATLLPVRRLPFWDVQSANAVAAFLSYLPFKLSIVSRFIIHNRRDGVPLLTIGAWMAGVAVVLLATLTPIVFATIWRKQVDWVYVMVLATGLVCAYLSLLLVARWFAGSRGLSRLHVLTDPVRFAPLDRAMRAGWFVKLHAGLDMLAHPWMLALSMSTRLADLLIQAARFSVAGYCLGTHVPFDLAILAASTFYLIGVLSPSGSLGARESGTTGIAALIAVPGLEGSAFTPIALTVSASEVLVNATGAMTGLLWLRVWRLSPATQAQTPATP
jgi:hypothetical protein